MGVTFDGASVNRKLVQLHSKEDKLVHKILNPFSTDARPFFFFFDPPHLIKTTRNCWASKARTLWVRLHTIALLYYKNIVYIHLQNNGKEIKWTHLWSLYYKNRSDTGLSLLSKLKYEHIHLNSFSKMRVDLAAQVRVIIEPETIRFNIIFIP